nr:MAG TPA: hypothetical protein [Caudoviricetes sp.]
MAKSIADFFVKVNTYLVKECKSIELFYIAGIKK